MPTTLNKPFNRTTHATTTLRRYLSAFLDAERVRELCSDQNVARVWSSYSFRGEKTLTSGVGRANMLNVDQAAAAYAHIVEMISAPRYVPNPNTSARHLLRIRRLEREIARLKRLNDANNNNNNNKNNKNNNDDDDDDNEQHGKEDDQDDDDDSDGGVFYNNN